jgi:hypothetical protein
MATVKVYKFELSHPGLGIPAMPQYMAQYMATWDFIERVHARVVEGSEKDVDASLVDALGRTKERLADDRAILDKQRAA